ncbi:unnamed protein product, partial [Urochloa humidicola]
GAAPAARRGGWQQQHRRAFRDAEGYVRHCLGAGDSSRWGRVAAVAHGTECVERHLHAILWCIAVAVEAAAEIAGSNPDEIE